MTAPVITAEKIVAAVRDLADRHPATVIDHVYNRGVSHMLYVHQGEPYCLLGQALSAVGAIDATLESQWHANRLSISDLMNYLLIDGDESDVQWLRWAQRYQDHRDCWGSAVSKADECIARDVPWSLRYEVA